MLKFLDHWGLPSFDISVNTEAVSVTECHLSVSVWIRMCFNCTFKKRVKKKWRKRRGSERRKAERVGGNVFMFSFCGMLHSPFTVWTHTYRVHAHSERQHFLLTCTWGCAPLTVREDGVRLMNMFHSWDPITLYRRRMQRQKVRQQKQHWRGQMEEKLAWQKTSSRSKQKQNCSKTKY